MKPRFTNIAPARYTQASFAPKAKKVVTAPKTAKKVQVIEEKENTLFFWSLILGTFAVAIIGKLGARMAHHQNLTQHYLLIFITILWPKKEADKIEAEKAAEQKRIDELKERILNCESPRELADEFGFSLIETADHWSGLIRLKLK